MLNENFEIIVLLEGVCEATGQSSQARTSYTNTEILWGYRFNPLLTISGPNNSYSTDYSMFDETYEVPMTENSAQYISMKKKKGRVSPLG